MSLEAVYGALLAALRSTGTPYAFIGALGAMAWGRARATTDLDLVVIATDASFAALRAALLREGFEAGAGVGPAEPTDTLPDIAVFWAGRGPATRVDVFIAKLGFEREVVERAVPATIFGQVVPVARPEAMLVYKLLASRPKDLLDIEGMLETRATAGWRLDWSLAEAWAEPWGIADKVRALRIARGE